jgi:hypothetical protein
MRGMRWERAFVPIIWVMGPGKRYGIADPMAMIHSGFVLYA